MFDAIVVGARCGGSPTAMLLARRGHRVLLVDRASFPSDTISTHWIWPPGLACLKRWGLLDRVLATCPSWREYRVDVGAFELAGAAPPIDGVGEICAPRRTVLDKLLLDAASQAGAEVREGFSVTGLTSNNGRVTGIRGHARSGTEVEEAARIVIGADGRNSLVAKIVGATEYNVKPVLTCCYYAYWSAVPRHLPGTHPRRRRVVVSAPTNDGLTITPIAFPRDEFDAVRSAPERHIWEAMDLAPELADLFHQGKLEERIYGSGDLPNFFRKPYGEGWALVGDSGYHKDPVLAQGISDAFYTSDMLSDAIHAGFSGVRPLNEALAEYHRVRDQHFLPMYEFNASHATLDLPPPEMLALFEALRYRQTERERFLGVIAGTVPVPEFLAPENVQRIVRGSAAGA
jgi:flavin-dependent dehydrogenase